MVISHRNLQLTYCTNIHPSTTMRGVMDNLDRYAVPLRAQFWPQQPFGIGLRLSGEESRELTDAQRLREFREFLDQRGLYVFTMNGFPYGPFHHQAVKAQVHAPDWLDPERVAYTLRLIDILSALLPEGLDGGISTSPLTYRAWVDEQDADLWTRLTLNVMAVVGALIRLRERTGQLIHIDIEPEPDGLLERSEHLAAFFTDHLMTTGAAHLTAEFGLTLAQAKTAIQDHVQVCFDTCHLAVAYESPRRPWNATSGQGCGSARCRSVQRFGSRCPRPLQSGRAPSHCSALLWIPPIFIRSLRGVLTVNLFSFQTFLRRFLLWKTLL